MNSMKTPAHAGLRPLKGIRILSLALNLPGPAALMRCQQMGARCTKLEPPAPPSGGSGDPMGQYNPAAYAQLHAGIRVVGADLKTPAGQKKLHALLAKTDVLLTSFRPSALHKLGLDGKTLAKQYPALSLVSIVGAPGAGAETSGHDLTYLAANGLVTALDLPPTLYADMGGALMASEAVLRAVLLGQQKGKGVQLEVALSDAAAWAALPRFWGLTLPTGAVGGAHAGYRVYACKDGRVAAAALEPHFAARLCKAAGVARADMASLMSPATHLALAQFFSQQTRAQLDALALAQDIPLHTLA